VRKNKLRKKKVGESCKQANNVQSAEKPRSTKESRVHFSPESTRGEIAVKLMMQCCTNQNATECVLSDEWVS